MNIHLKTATTSQKVYLIHNPLRDCKRKTTILTADQQQLVQRTIASAITKLTQSRFATISGNIAIESLRQLSQSIRKDPTVKQNTSKHILLKLLDQHKDNPYNLALAFHLFEDLRSKHNTQALLLRQCQTAIKHVTNNKLYQLVTDSWNTGINESQEGLSAIGQQLVNLLRNNIQLSVIEVESIIKSLKQYNETYLPVSNTAMPVSNVFNSTPTEID